MKAKYVDYSISMLVLFLAFTSISCMDDIDTDPKNLIGRWRMEKVVENGQTIFKPDSKRWVHKDVEIEFFANGEIAGTLSYDRFTGDYRTTDVDSIAFNFWPDTKAGDSSWGYLLCAHIKAVNTFTIRKKDFSFNYKELKLIYDNGELIFKKVD
jgi:hypothetical protein